MTIYSIYKDDLAKNTVNCIKKLLKNYCINVKEEYTAVDKEKKLLCPSVRIQIENTTIGSNGKGTSYENALASGYGEFMERLQNLWLIKCNVPDLKLIDKKNIHHNLLGETQIDIEQEKIPTLPYYSVKYNCITNIPQYLISSTNGFAAGNTYEEAIVQGLSEICERYVMKKILVNKVSLPDIPKELYMKYDNIKNIIKYYNEKDYEVFIKDASLGEKYPVVCTFIMNKKENVVLLCFGAHPVLPVAIERTLTEIFQGRELTPTEEDRENRIIFIKKDYYNKYLKNNRVALFEHVLKRSVNFEDNDDLIKQFAYNSNSLIFDKEAWVDCSLHLSNKGLLEFLLKNIMHITQNNIYIRDVSFLGFPSVSIYIPTMSTYILSVNASQYYAMRKWRSYDGQRQSEYDNIMDFKKLLEFLCSHNTYSSNLTSKYPVEYIMILTSIVLKDYDNVIKYSNIMLDKWIVKKKNIVKLISEYYTYKQDKISDDEIDKILKKSYSIEDIQFFYKFINNLSFKVIKQIIAHKKNDKETEIIIKEISEKLQNVYSTNVPNQMKLEKIFDFI